MACYVLRASEQGPELLVFEHVDDDAASPSGIQVPAGAMLPFESIDDAALREVNEETGLIGLTYTSQLGGVEVAFDSVGGPSMTTFVQLTAPNDGRQSWQHQVTGDGEDAGMTFACRWEPLPLGVALADGQDAFLPKLSLVSVDQPDD